MYNIVCLLQGQALLFMSAGSVGCWYWNSLLAIARWWVRWFRGLGFGNIRVTPLL